MDPQGARTWFVADCYLPRAGSGELTGHEAICILNTTDETAHVTIDFYFEDREPHLDVPVTVGPRRTLHVRTDRPEMLGGFQVPREVPYAVRVRSSVPIVVQYTRLDVTQPNLALMTCMAFPAT